MTEAEKYAGVLQHAHELSEADPKLTFGRAIQRAVEASDLPPPSEELKGRMLIALFQIVGSGFPTKVEA